MRSSLIRPLALSSSYLTLDPNGISMTQSNSCGSLSPGVTSCQGWIIGFGNCFYFSGGSQLSAISSQLSVRSERTGVWFPGRVLSRLPLPHLLPHNRIAPEARRLADFLFPSLLSGGSPPQSLPVPDSRV